jgi:hypothetical protein
VPKHETNLKISPPAAGGRAFAGFPMHAHQCVGILPINRLSPSYRRAVQAYYAVAAFTFLAACSIRAATARGCDTYIA